MNTSTLSGVDAEFRKIDKLEPSWLYDIRKGAWERYREIPSPEKTAGLWRYTKPELFLPVDQEKLLNILPILSDDSDGHRHPSGAQYAAYGYTRDDLASIPHLGSLYRDSGVIFKDLLSAARDHDELMAKYFGRLIGADFGKFEALNLALWNSGFFLYIPDDLAVERPIRINRHPGAVTALSRLLIVVGRNSHVTVIDDLSGESSRSANCCNSAVEIFAGESSRVKYVNLQRLKRGGLSYMTERANLEANSNLYSLFGGMGGAVSKVNAGAVLDGRGAESRMSGIVFGDADQHFDYHTVHHHRAGDSFSNINFKVVLKDEAVSAYTGLIRIEKETADCEAYQENRNLLLNKGTRAESIPELEILTDQVRCTHGATMGPIDPEMLFYLWSRGIDPEEATRMIVTGFVEPMINQAPSDLHDLMGNMVQDKLQGVLL